MLFEAALGAVFEANLKIVFLVLIGVLLTLRGKLDERGISDLGAITYNVALPALIFNNVATGFEPNDLIRLWILPFTAIVYCCSGYLIAIAAARVLDLRENEVRPVCCAIMFGNCGSLAIGIIGTLGETAIHDPHELSAFQRASIGYIAIFLIGQNLAMFTWGEYLLDSEPKSNSEPAAPTRTTRDAVSSSVDSTRHETENHEPLFQEDVAINPTVRDAAQGSPLLPTLSPRRYGTAGVATNPDTSIRELRNRRFSMSRANMMSLNREPRVEHEAIQRAVSHLALDTHALVDDHALAGDSKTSIGNEHGESASLATELFGDDYRRHLEDDLRGQGGSNTNLIMLRNPWMDSAHSAMKLGRRLLSSPPLGAALLGIAVVLMPPVKAMLFGPEAPLRAFTGALALCGKMQVPASMIMLSGAGTIRLMEDLKIPSKREESGSPVSGFGPAGIDNLDNSERKAAPSSNNSQVQTPRSPVAHLSRGGPSFDELFTFSAGARAILLFGRVITGGFVGFFWYKLMVNLDLVSTQGLLPFVLFLEAVVPSAQNVVMLLLVHGDVSQGHAMAVSILEQYVICLPFLTLYLGYMIMLLKPFEQFEGVGDH